MKIEKLICYPGEKATIEESRESVLIMKKTREFIRERVEA
jgi:hypothetical protein